MLQVATRANRVGIDSYLKESAARPQSVVTYKSIMHLQWLDRFYSMLASVVQPTCNNNINPLVFTNAHAPPST